MRGSATPPPSLSLSLNLLHYIYICALHGAKCVVGLSAVIAALSRTDIRGLAADATALSVAFSSAFWCRVSPPFPPQIERAIRGGGGCASSEAQGYLLQREESLSSARGILFGSLFTDTRLCRQYVYVNKAPPPEYLCSRQQFVPNDLARRKLSAFSLVASCLPFEKLNYRR